MQLADYLRINDIRLVDFSARTGLAPSSISKLASGANRPTLETMRVIQEATKGDVMPADFMALHAAGR